MPTLNLRDNELNLNSPMNLKNRDNEFKESEVSTLSNAAKISHLVNETTIGALSCKTIQKQNSEILPQSNKNYVQRQQSLDPWKRTDVWRTVDLDNEKRRSNGTINLIDYKAIQLKMALKNAEKIRQRHVRMEMAQRQVKFNELEEMMNNLKIDLIEKSATKLQKNLLLKEEQILEVVQQLENNARLADEQASREMEVYSKKMAEKINRLKRVEEVRGYFQSIKSMKNLFIMLFEKFVKTCISNQQHLKNFEQYTQVREQYLTRYENLIKIVNSGQLSSAEVDALEKICDDVKETQRTVEEDIKSAEELVRTIADRNERLRVEEEQNRKENANLQFQQQQQQLDKQQQQQQQEQQQQQTQQHAGTVDATDAPKILTAISALHRFVSNDRLIHYQKIMKFYEDYAQSVKPLQNDDNMRKFRYDCQKAVNTLTNTISAVSPNHLQDKFDKLALILSGNEVKVGTHLKTSIHPLGIRFANLLVAKKFVNQAEHAVSTRAASPIASLIISIWQKFPDFGTLFLAYFYKACPYLVPYFIPHVEGQSSEEYLKSVGFTFVDNVCEEQNTFLKRLSGQVRLYSTVIISKPRQAINKPHPHGIENAWIWLSNILNLDPLPNMSATMIYEFIAIVGADLLKIYGKQFHKVLKFMKTQYLEKLREVDSIDSAPRARFENLIKKITTEGGIEPPADILPANFW